MVFLSRCSFLATTELIIPWRLPATKSQQASKTPKSLVPGGLYFQVYPWTLHHDAGGASELEDEKESVALKLWYLPLPKHLQCGWRGSSSESQVWARQGAQTGGAGDEIRWEQQGTGSGATASLERGENHNWTVDELVAVSKSRWK